MYDVLVIILGIVSVFTIAIILMQKTKSSGFTSNLGGTNSYFNDNKKGETFEGKLKNLTKILIAIILILLFAISRIDDTRNGNTETVKDYIYESEEETEDNNDETKASEENSTEQDENQDETVEANVESEEE